MRGGTSKVDNRRSTMLRLFSMIRALFQFYKQNICVIENLVDI